MTCALQERASPAWQSCPQKGNALIVCWLLSVGLVTYDAHNAEALLVYRRLSQ